MMNRKCLQLGEYKICKKLLNIYLFFIWCLCIKQKSAPVLVAVHIAKLKVSVNIPLLNKQTGRQNNLVLLLPMEDPSFIQLVLPQLWCV